MGNMECSRRDCIKRITVYLKHGGLLQKIDYSSILQQPLKFMVKNKVVLKERDARSDLANFIGEKKYKNIC